VCKTVGFSRREIFGRPGSNPLPNPAIYESRRLRCAPPLARRQRRALPWKARLAHAGPGIAGTTRRRRRSTGHLPGAAASHLPQAPDCPALRHRVKWRPSRDVARGARRARSGGTPSNPALSPTRGCRPGPRSMGSAASLVSDNLLPARHAPWPTYSATPATVRTFRHAEKSGARSLGETLAPADM